MLDRGDSSLECFSSAFSLFLSYYCLEYCFLVVLTVSVGIYPRFTINHGQEAMKMDEPSIDICFDIRVFKSVQWTCNGI